jgi:hypothetical protein
MTTKNLPTDKNGNVYYGPTTFQAAVAQINVGREPDRVARMLADAGYAKIAAKITKNYGTDASKYGCPI